MAGDARQISYELTLDDKGPDGIVVLDFQAREALSEGCAVTVRADTSAFLDGATLLGKPGSLCIHFGDETPRWFHGVIARAVARKAPSDANLIEIEIRSRLWLLGLGRDNRVFTDASVKT